MSNNVSVPLCFIDTETTGLDPHKRVVWELAMIRREPDGTEIPITLQVELTNREMAQADPEALKIGGFEERYDPIQAHSKRVVAAYIREFTDGAHIVAACPDFDVHGLQGILDSVGELGQWDYHLIDVRTFAQGVFLTKLGEGSVNDESWEFDWPAEGTLMAEFLGVTLSEEDEHTAFGDADYVKRFYDAVVEYASNSFR